MRFSGNSEFWFAFGNTLTGGLALLLSWAIARLHHIFKQWKKALDKEESGSTLPLDFSHQKDTEIGIVLDRALRRFKAMRCYLTKFHNGERFTDGSEIIKKSRTHERVRPGISYQADRFQALLITAVPEEMKLVLEEGPGWAITSNLPDSRFRWLLETGGVTAVARADVRAGGKLIGFLGLDFDDRPDDIEGLQQQIGQLEDYARELGLILADYPSVTQSNKATVKLYAKNHLPRIFMPHKIATIVLFFMTTCFCFRAWGEGQTTLPSAPAATQPVIPFFPPSIPGPGLAACGGIEITHNAGQVPCVVHVSAVTAGKTGDDRFFADRTLTYHWMMGDPAGPHNEYKSGWNVAHLYTRPGTYWIQLQVSDGKTTRTFSTKFSLTADARKQVQVSNVTGLIAALKTPHSNVALVGGNYTFRPDMAPGGIPIANDVILHPLDARPAIINIAMPFDRIHAGTTMFFYHDQTQDVLMQNIGFTGAGHLYAGAFHGETWMGWIHGVGNSMIGCTFDRVSYGMQLDYRSWYGYLADNVQVAEWSIQNTFMWVEGHHVVCVGDTGKGSFWENVLRSADHGIRRGLLYECSMTMPGYPPPFQNKTTYTLRNQDDMVVAYCKSYSFPSDGKGDVGGGNWFGLEPRTYLEECRNTLLEHNLMCGTAQFWFHPSSHGVEGRFNDVYLPYGQGAAAVSLMLHSHIPPGLDPTTGLNPPVPVTTNTDGVVWHDNVLYTPSPQPQVKFYNPDPQDKPNVSESVYREYGNKNVLIPSAKPTAALPLPDLPSSRPKAETGAVPRIPPLGG